ncbi:hypothetical protein [Terrisporobacter muris]|uniref:Uncharacterized protein n=1 Tax=Terrisporobacter muris TaxID=2963284 RepID=A0A9X2M7H6_9FIRM|nr:hypothetical protein [Terrisporobacter muris]MCR1821269.1 hypothetical protein [Terrisporobacter muris]
MNKSDLKDGMVVTIRGGQQCILIERNLFKNNFTLNSTLFDYNEDLTHKKNKNNDIVKVFGIGKLKELWEREEVDWSKVPVGTKVKVSDDEIEWFNAYFIKKSSPITAFYVISAEGKLSDWSYCKLAEKPKEEVTFYDIDKEMHQYCYDHSEMCNRKCDTCGIKYILANYNLTRKDNK